MDNLYLYLLTVSGKPFLKDGKVMYVTLDLETFYLIDVDKQEGVSCIFHTEDPTKTRMATMEEAKSLKYPWKIHLT